MADEKKQITEYVVLLERGDGGSQGAGIVWERLGVVRANSSSAAKRAALAEHHPEGGTVVAVPTRSWEPEDLKPKLSFG